MISNVERQGGDIVGLSTLVDVSDTTDAASLIGMLDTSLLNQGIPVVANDDTLSLTTSNNDYFVLTSSDEGNLGAFVCDAVTSVPEPSTCVAGALLLLPLGVSALRILRKRQTG